MKNKLNKQLKAQYLDYPVDGNWRIRCYEEIGDFIINVEYLPSEKGCISVLRFDQSHHKFYHADFYNYPKFEFFPDAKTFEEKVDTAFRKLKEYCAINLVKYEGKFLIYSNVIEGYKNQILNHEIPLKSLEEIITRTSRSFTVMASIVNPKSV